MKKNYYITTAIAYTNSKPHIGHALELVQVDTLARYYRAKVGNDNTYFLTGTDDHGIKIFRSAKKSNQSPEEFVAGNIKLFKDLVNKLNISNTGFVSTSDKTKHWPGAQLLWKQLAEAGDIYKKQYQGLYCVGCEAYLTEKDLVDGKCPNHNKAPEVISEENYFFKLSKYKDIVKKKIETDELKITPVERKNEILNVIDKLEDISFSRPKEKLPWGIPVPGDNSQVMYVWCDALSNYITGLGYGLKDEEKFKQFWPVNVHCIGKDILKFHAVIWPAMLLAVGLELPKEIFVHGFITSEGKKMSKTIGNVVDPMDVANKYGTDALRYYLLREIPATTDGDFSWERFKDIYNGELANQLGNLVMRVVKLASKYNLEFKLPTNNQGVVQNLKLEHYKFNESLGDSWQKIRELNEYIETEKPWELAKNDQEKLEKVLIKGITELGKIAANLQFCLPETSKKIKRQLETLEAEVLFPRIEE